MPFSSQLRTGSNRIRITNDATSALRRYRPSLRRLADPVEQEAVDRPQQHDERAEHRHLADQLVEVEQAVAEQRLRQEVEVEDAEDVADRGPRDAEARQHVGQRQRRRDEAAEREVADARALDALGRRAVLQYMSQTQR